jgi:hypothetical protein
VPQMSTGTCQGSYLIRTASARALATTASPPGRTVGQHHRDQRSWAAVSASPAGIQWPGSGAPGSSGTRQEFSRYSAAQPSTTAATNVITAVSASSRGTLAVSEPAR